MRLPSIAILTALLVSTRLVSASVTPQVVLLSNLPGNGSSVVVENDAWVAESFTLPATYTPTGGSSAVAGQKLNFLGIEVTLNRTGTPSIPYYAFRLYNNIPPTGNVQPTPGTPGQIIGLFSMPKFEQPTSLNSTSPTTGTFVLNTYASVILTPGYTYWVVFSSTAPQMITSGGQTITNPNTLGWVTSTNPVTALPNAMLNTGSLIESVTNGLKTTQYPTGWTPLAGNPFALGIHIVTL